MEQIDSLRGIAAVAVMFYHFVNGFHTHFGDAGRVIPVLEYGARGVDLFFIISGFVILKSVERSRGFVAFAVHRFARLWPTLLVAASLTMGVIWATGLDLGGRGWREYVWSLSVAPEFFGVRALDFSYWTLQWEMFFYGLIGVVVLLMRVRRVEVFCLAWLAGSVLLGSGHYVPWKVEALLNVPYCHMFIDGMMLFRLFNNPGNRLALGVLGASLAVGFVKGSVSEAAGLCGFSLLVFLAARSALGWLGRPGLVWLGRVSYPLYLIHQMLGYAVIKAVVGAGLPVMAGVGVATVCAVGMAAGLRAWVEVPAERAIRRGYEAMAAAWGAGGGGAAAVGPGR